LIPHPINPAIATTMPAVLPVAALASDLQHVELADQLAQGD